VNGSVPIPKAYRKPWRALLLAFAGWSPLIAKGRVRLEVYASRCLDDGGCAHRSVAQAVYSTPRGEVATVQVVSRLFDFPRHVVLGVLAHELGHLADESDGEEAELRADAWALWVTGSPVRYWSEDQLQSLGGSGKWPRPRGLHR